MSTAMLLTLSVVSAAVAISVAAFLRVMRQRNQREIDQHSIGAEQLHTLMNSDPQLLLFDVRQPLDLLAYPEIIPKAQRIEPDELLQNPSLIPKDKDVVVYCTCPSDKTSRLVLRKALALHFFRVRFLKGGLEAWKAQGYPVQPYDKAFRLYHPSLVARSG